MSHLIGKCFLKRIITEAKFLYVDSLSLVSIPQIAEYGLKVLNMVDLKANFRGKNENAFCRRCGVHEEYVEHLWECSLFENKNLPNFTNMTKNNPKVLSIIQKYVEKFINKRS